MVGSERPHQGVVLEVEQMFLESIDFLEPWKPKTADEMPPLWIALDRIQDPQNLGAIMRSCVYFGVNGIVPTCV
jgi:tRNA G18 (ribose-2'-O)-methylase SpoU